MEKKLKVPKSLKNWFLMHFFLDYLFGLPLLLFPKFLTIFGFPVTDLFTARLVGAALLGIGGVSLLKNKSSLESYDSLLSLKIIWSISALIGILITMSEGYPKIGWLIFVIFLIFNFIWVYYKIKLNKFYK